VYLIYGTYELLNVMAGGVGEAQAVLMRAAKPLGQAREASGREEDITTAGGQRGARTLQGDSLSEVTRSTTEAAYGQ
jgi:3-methyladenine DNA glycosylase Mpg